MADKQRHLQSVALELYNRRTHQHYTENSTLRWRGVSEKMCPPKQLPVYSDCSSFVTYIYWTLFGQGHDFMNGEAWAGGWTGSLAKYGALVKGPGGGNNASKVTTAELQVGDLIFYCK
jgi:cell wall-associated NlpC family hydrolase